MFVWQRDVQVSLRAEKKLRELKCDTARKLAETQRRDTEFTERRRGPASRKGTKSESGLVWREEGKHFTIEGR